MVTLEASGELLASIRSRVDNAIAILDMGAEYQDSKSLREGLSLLVEAIRDVRELLDRTLAGTFLGSAHRKGSRPKGAEKLIEYLRNAKAIEEVAIEAFLRDRHGIETEEAIRFTKEAFKAIKSLKKLAESTRRTVEENWPGVWDLALDSEFSNYLPRRRKGR